MELFDTHAHVYDKRFDNDREQVLSDVFAHLKYVVCPSENLETSRKTTDLVNRYPRLYGAVGIHPHETCHATEDSLQELESMAREIIKSLLSVKSVWIIIISIVIKKCSRNGFTDR